MPDTATSKKAVSPKPRNRLPRFGRPRRITSRKKTTETTEPAKTFGDLVQSKMGTKSASMIPRVNFLSPADRQLFMELAQAMREHTDTLREVHKLEPIDRSAPKTDDVDLVAFDPEGEQVSAEASSDDETVSGEHDAAD